MTEWTETCEICGAPLQTLANEWVDVETGTMRCNLRTHDGRGAMAAPKHRPSLPDMTDRESVEAWLDA